MKRRERSSLRGWLAALVAALLAPGALAFGCDDAIPPSYEYFSVTGGGTAGSGAGSSWDGGHDAGAPPCDAATPRRGEWNPDASCWTPVRWKSPCLVEMALDPDLAAPPLTWVPCGDDAPGCEQQFEQPLLDTDEQSQKASIVSWRGGHRIGLRSISATELTTYASIYDADGTPMFVWRVRSVGDKLCHAARPIVTPERVWFGVFAISPDSTLEAVYIAPRWDDLATVDKAVIEAPYFFQAWWASSEVAVGWVLNGLTVHIEDLVTGKRALFGGGQPGNYDYSYPQVIGSSAVALTAPDGYPDLTVWDRSTESFADLIQPPPPAMVADGRSDGQTLAWIVVPEKGEPGELWTSPMAVTPQDLQPTMRRPTPPVLTQSSVASNGYYAVYSFSDVLLPGGGPGDGQVHVYRLSDARHWSFPVPKTTIYTVWIYYVDEDYVFYSGYGPILRQRLDVLGPGDPPP